MRQHGCKFASYFCLSQERRVWLANGEKRAPGQFRVRHWTTAVFGTTKARRASSETFSPARRGLAAQTRLPVFHVVFREQRPILDARARGPVERVEGPKTTPSGVLPRPACTNTQTRKKNGKNSVAHKGGGATPRGVPETTLLPARQPSGGTPSPRGDALVADRATPDAREGHASATAVPKRTGKAENCPDATVARRGPQTLRKRPSPQNGATPLACALLCRAYRQLYKRRASDGRRLRCVGNTAPSNGRRRSIEELRRAVFWGHRRRPAINRRRVADEGRHQTLGNPAPSCERLRAPDDRWRRVLGNAAPCKWPFCA